MQNTIESSESNITRTVVARFDKGGTFDQAFNDGHGYSLGTGFGINEGYYVEANTDDITVSGRIFPDALVGERCGGNVFKLRSQNGEINTFFGDQGDAIIELPDPSERIQTFKGTHVESDGSVIFCAQKSQTINSSTQFFAVFGKLTARGFLDHTFGNDGLIHSGLPELTNVGFCKKDDGTFVTIAVIALSRTPEIVLIHCNPSDDTVSITHTRFANIVSLIPARMSAFNGKLYITGGSLDANGRGYFIASLNLDGTPDLSFGNQGIVLERFGALTSGTVVTNAIHVSPNGITVVGYTSPPSYEALAVARHLLSGPLDKSFSGDGKRVVTYRHLKEIRVNGVLGDADGRIYLCGAANKQMFLTAFEANGDTVANFGSNSNQMEQGTLLYSDFQPPTGSITGEHICLSADSRMLIVCGTSKQ